MIDLSEEDIKMLEESTQTRVSGQNLVMSGLTAIDVIQRLTDVYKTITYEQWLAFFGPGLKADEEMLPEDKFDDYRDLMIAYYEHLFNRLTCAQLTEE